MNAFAIAIILSVGCQSEPSTLREQAEQAQENLEQAREEAAEIVADSEEDAVEMVADARENASDKIQQAQQKATGMVASAKKGLDQKLDELSAEQSVVPSETIPVNDSQNVRTESSDFNPPEVTDEPSQ